MLFKHHDERNVHALTEVIADEKAFLTMAKQHTADLEKVLQSDDEVDKGMQDSGWDRS